MTDPDGPKSWKEGLGLLNSGFVMVGCIALGLLLGLWLDEKFETSPWWMIGGIVLGAAAGFVQFFRAVSKADG